MDSTRCENGGAQVNGVNGVQDSEPQGNLTDCFIPKAGRNMRGDMIRIGVEGTTEDVRDLYNEIAEYYDEYCETTGRNTGARNLAKIVQNLKPNKNARILDVACGNGILGIQLKKLGYTNVDGLDFAQKMVDLCKSKGVFNNYICASIEPDKEVPLGTDNTYDVACMNGSMTLGCLTPSHVPALARMVKSGGCIVFNITSYTGKNFTEYKEESVVAKLQSFVDSGILSKWSKGTHTYFETTGEEAFAYVATVA